MPRRSRIALLAAGVSVAVVMVVAALPGLVGASAHAGEPDDDTTVSIGSFVSLRVPKDMTREVRSLGGGADMLTLVDGSDMMVVVVYRRSGRERPPSAAEALSAHADELERVLAPATRTSARRRILGRDRAAVLFSRRTDEAARDAWVVAAEARGKTIVVSAVVVTGSPNDQVMTGMLEGLEVE